MWLEPVAGAGERVKVASLDKAKKAEAVRGWILDHMGREEGTWDEVVVDAAS
ncbi:MAG: hypothetical protein LW650_13225 [Planctomycetaceae bacterium]|nr:hypothetical protein [Phycisphaerales bacterium]MCE2654370.1 hypothetical protein [Planctomycetaceae bacterium]